MDKNLQILTPKIIIVLIILAVDMCLQRPQSVHVGRERHEKDWKNLVFPVSQYMCVGGGGKMFKLLILTDKKIQSGNSRHGLFLGILNVIFRSS